jgi:tol-pal system protein YbgF
MIRLMHRLAPVALALATGACFATRNDVRILQEDVASVRAATLRADSARAAQIGQVATTLAEVTDSIRSANNRLGRWQGTVAGDLRSIQEQLIQIQALTGASQRQLDQLRAEMEERNQQLAPTAPGTPPTPGDTSRPPAQTGGTPAAAQPAGPGPASLYRLASDQMSRGSHATARSGFQDLLTQYPNADQAPDAQYYIGETLLAEGNSAAADSVFMLVVSKYPSSQRAATALYKHGLFLQRANRNSEARQAFQSVIDKYPRSDEAALAREQLRSGGD